MKTHFELRNFEAARDTCKTEGGDLIPVKNENVKRYLHTLLKQSGGNNNNNEFTITLSYSHCLKGRKSKVVHPNISLPPGNVFL